MRPSRRSTAAIGLAALAIISSISSAGALEPASSTTAEQNNLSLSPSRTIGFATEEGTWMALDVSPDGRTILFDLMGDIYAVDAKGGPAHPILRGMAFETQPVFSPDGSKIAFVSDRSGTENIWVANADGTGLKRLSNDSDVTIYASPVWSPDGDYVYASRTVPSLLAFELWMFHKDGGSGVQVTKGRPKGTEPFDDRHNALGATVSPDGRHLYYATKLGGIWTERDLPHWSIARRDLESGVEEVIIASQGGAMRPTLSPDGRFLAYASRHGLRTGLRLRDLQTGDDRWLTFPIDRDGQEGGYYSDLVPRYDFSPDGKAILLSVDGEIKRLDVAESTLSDIPFSAPVELGIGASLRVEQHEETGPVRVRVIQSPRQSPDGRSLVFSALGRLYIQDLHAGDAPRRLMNVPGPAFQPAWSPDGRDICFVTWSASDGGHIWIAAANGRGVAKKLTDAASFYSEPSFSPDGETIVALRSSHHARLREETEIKLGRASDIVRVPAAGGTPSLVAHASGAKALQFGNDPDRILFQAPAGLSSVRMDGSDLRRHVVIEGRAASQYVDGPLPSEEVRISPDGRRALVKTASQLYLVAVPHVGGPTPPVVNLSDPSVARLKLTEVGADYFDWADGGRMMT